MSSDESFNVIPILSSPSPGLPLNSHIPVVYQKKGGGGSGGMSKVRIERLITLVVVGFTKILADSAF